MRGSDKRLIRRIRRAIEGDSPGCSPLQAVGALSKFLNGEPAPTDGDQMQELVSAGRRVLCGLSAAGADGFVPRRAPLALLLRAFSAGALPFDYLGSGPVEEQPAPPVPKLWRGVARDVDALAERLLVMRREAVSETDWKGL